MWFGKFDKILLIFIVVLGLIVVASAANVLVGGVVPSDMAFHPLKFVTIGDGTLTSVDADEDGVIDKAEMVFCDGIYQSVETCPGLGGGTGTGDPLVVKSAEIVIREDNTYSIQSNTGNLDAEDTIENIATLDEFTGGQDYWGAACNFSNGWIATSCLWSKDGGALPDHDFSIAHNGCKVDDEERSGTTNILLRCAKISGNVVGGTGTTIPTCQSGKIIKSDGTGWVCADETGGAGGTGGKILSGRTPRILQSECGWDEDHPCSIDISAGNFTNPRCVVTMINHDGTGYTENMVVKNQSPSTLNVWKGQHYTLGTSMILNWICVEDGLSGDGTGTGGTGCTEIYSSTVTEFLNDDHTVWTEIPGISITENFSGGKVAISFDTFGNVNAPSVTSEGHYRLLVDGVAVNWSKQTGNTFHYGGPVSMAWAGNLTAGSHTITVETKPNKSDNRIISNTGIVSGEQAGTSTLIVLASDATCSGTGTSGALECTTVQNTGSVNASTLVDAQCPTDYVVTGGGCENLAKNVAMDRNYLNGWGCKHGGSGLLTVTATAICCKGGTGTTIPTCADGEYLKMTASGWGCEAPQDLSSLLVEIVTLNNLSCCEYGNTASCNPMNASPTSCGNSGDGTNWVLAHIMNNVDSVIGGQRLSLCPWKNPDGSPIPDASNVYGNNTKFQECIGDAVTIKSICHRVCKDSSILTMYGIDKTFTTGYAIENSPHSNNGVIACACLGYS